MKSMIHDYFGQSPRGNGKVDSVGSVANEVPNKTLISEELSSQDNSGIVNNGKENVKAKEEGSKNKCSKEKSKTPPMADTASAKKKVQRKRSLSTKKLKSEDATQGNTDQSNTQTVNSKKSTAQNFSLKIRLKAQEEGEDNCIEEFASPENTDGKVKELKSPQGTMLKYLISQKNPSPSEKECNATTKVKVSRDISDYFSPSKQNETVVTPTATPSETQLPGKIATDRSKKKNAGGKVKDKVSSTSKSARKTKQNRISVSKEDTSEDTKSMTDTSESLGITEKSNSKLKPKSSKKSLSLLRNETKAKTIEPISHPEEAKLLKSDNVQELPVAKLMTTALKKIMAKASSEEEGSSPSETATKKRKRDDNDDTIDHNLSKALKEDSPVKSKRKLSRTNQVDCDSDDDVSSKQTISNHVDLSALQNAGVDMSEAATPKLEESKRNSLMNYFSKVSKEEALAKDEKIEMKVKALVHSPPTTPSKKTKRRSIQSLPGGAASLNKKKIRAKLKENVNAIDVISAEEINGSDQKGKDSSSVPSVNNDKQSNPVPSSSVKSSKSLSLKATRSPPKNTPHLNSSDSPSAKRDATPKISKKSLSKAKQGKKNTSVSGDKSSKSVKNITSPEEENLATPLPPLKDESEVEIPKTPSDPKMAWKLRVCLTPVQLPSVQGTLLEEESDTDEIFLQRKDKKRKLERQRTDDKAKQTQFADKSKQRVDEERSSSPDIIFEKEERSSVKIAPLFTRKADTQARQLFLQSGVPDQVKRVLETQRSFEEQETELFPKESHVQQRNEEDWAWSLPAVTLALRADCTEVIPQTLSRFSLSDLTGCCNIREEVDRIESASCKGPEMRAVFDLPLDIMKPILRLIKLESPDLKVGNTFKVLRSKFREEKFSRAAALSAESEIQRPKRKTNRKSSNSKLPTMAQYRAHVWTEKYKPCTASEIVGNNLSIQQLKRWLELWRKASEDFSNKPSSKDDIKRKKKRKDDFDDDDDFLVSENSSEGTQSNLPVGAAVLYGPNGSGKTSTVYALARDLGYKVLEVNASEKRNGKLVLSKLSEATQSHQVQQGNTVEQGFAALFGDTKEKKKTAQKGGEKNSKTKNSKPSNESDEDKAKKMSLILFEDVDVVFEEEDEGFLSAITTLVSTSKRPVILTTTDPESPMVSRFISSASLNLPFSNSTNMLSSWLQIVSLLEGVYVAPDTVKNLVSLCKGDFRRALLQMQLWVLSGGNNMPMPSMTYHLQGRKPKKDSKSDNSDDMDDIDDNENDHNNCTPSILPNPDCIAAILGLGNIQEDRKDIKENQTFVKVPFPLDLGLFWWNTPPQLSMKQMEHAELPVMKEDPPIPGAKRLLDDSFIASFCTDDGTNTDSATNEDSDAPCSQAKSTSGESGESQDSSQIDSEPSQSSLNQISYKSCCSEKEMKAMSSHFLIISSVDVIAHSSQLNTLSNMEPITRFSYPLMKDSLSLVKLEVDGPNCVLNSMAQDISHWLAEQSLNETKACLCPNSSSQSPYNYCLPSQQEYRWRDVHAKAEQAAILAVPLCARLERRAISTDYMPALRTFCRLERDRSIINTKRRNRFYHYLKGLGAHLTESQLELLCRSMCDV